MAAEGFQNPGSSMASGAGIQAAQFVADQGAQAVLTGSVGPNAFGVLQAAGLPIFTVTGGTVREAVEAYKAGRLSSIAQPGSMGGGVGRGGGMGRGRGGGRGMGTLGGYGGGWSQAVPPRPPVPPATPPPPAAGPARTEDVDALKAQVEELRTQLDRVLKQLEALQKK